MTATVVARCMLAAGALAWVAWLCRTWWRHAGQEVEQAIDPPAYNAALEDYRADEGKR